jgi:hypothetical protein
LFYGFIFLNVLSLAPTLIDPTFSDGGCMFAVENEYAESLLITWMQCMHLNIIGFIFFAARAGLQAWNVLSVLVLAGGSVWFHGQHRSIWCMYHTFDELLLGRPWLARGDAGLCYYGREVVVRQENSDFSRTATFDEDLVEERRLLECIYQSAVKVLVKN